MIKETIMYGTVVDIDMKRYLCIHSVSQLVDITLQSLLYQRGLIPEPASTFRKGNSHASEQFTNTYTKVSRILTETFRTTNCEQIREFVILIGGTPYSPKEIYRIYVPMCKEQSGTDGSDFGSQKSISDLACEELSAKERRLVFSSVALSKTAVSHFENCPIPGKTDKVFMFIRTRGQLNTFTEGLAEDESFELPDNDVLLRRKIRLLRIRVNSPFCNGVVPTTKSATMTMDRTDADNSPAIDSEDDEEERDENAPFNLWYRIAPYFTNLN